MSAHRVRAYIRRLLGVLVLALIGSTGAMADERADGAIPPTLLPAPVLRAGLPADTPLSGDAVPWAALSAPPSHGDAGGMLQPGGGGGPRFRYYGLDALGSVRVLFDAAGAVVSRADYEPFGAAASTTTGPQPREQYTGHERDGEVGVDYFGARLYLAAIGRMPSVDPLYAGAVGNPQRWNRYAYALNSPLVMIDPDGRLAAADCNSWIQIELDGQTVDTQVVCVSARAGGGSEGGSAWTASAVADMLAWLRDRMVAPVGGPAADTWDGPTVLEKYPNAAGFGKIDPTTLTEPNGNVTTSDIVSDVLNAGGIVGGLRQTAVKALPAAIKIPMGSAKAGMEHILLRHASNAVTTTSVSRFAQGMGPSEIRALVSEATRGSTAWRVEGASRVLDVNMGRAIGTDHAGSATSGLRIVTDAAGSVITAYPIRVP
ncbi:MAG: RHS repeat-associated core domain-containing protein [Acidobacteria bacterium]|nr:RHS repeat-associated core domain-containing protein [Acidobacteriota bacterium]